MRKNTLGKYVFVFGVCFVALSLRAHVLHQYA